ALDAPVDLLEDKKGFIDFEVEDDNNIQLRGSQTTFSKWWDNQLRNNNVISHYRTEGYFMEFTRNTASTVAAQIAHESHHDILVRGAVGSGKSTGLPFYLSSRGKVLVLEPTKPLAENVYKQLKCAPFHSNPVLMMRGTTYYGSSPITIMTSGYALHYFANNSSRLSEYEFVIMDECHVHDANAIAFSCLLHEHDYKGKFIKASATPPGRETEFTTQFPVDLKIEEQLSFTQFVERQGTGTNADMTVDCDNILVYVASYNEVDQLSKLLLDKGYIVTKVDGRTMRTNKSDIETKGSQSKKHFIVATNIIENGVTLDIEGVVDFGTKVVPQLDVDNRMLRYHKCAVSYGERIQRLGRVGRHKPGKALRIGVTEKGISKTPTAIATEAAFYSFSYGLPVMMEGVTPNLLSECTVAQAKSMLIFELPIMYMVNLVRFDGSMHPVIHNLLKSYKLRDSDIVLNKMAIPNRVMSYWLTCREYKHVGVQMDLEDHVKIPFHAKDIPDKLHADIYKACIDFKADAGFSRIATVNACKIAYTLQTDPASLQRTVKIIDKLIEAEVKKSEYFAHASDISCSSNSFSLSSIMQSIRARHTSNYTVENISVLRTVRAQLMEFKNLNSDYSKIADLSSYGALDCLQFE
nr:CI protein [Mediterranean ruda virus]